MRSFPFYKQLDVMDCGPACLQMISKYYGKSWSLDSLRKKSFITREGVSLLGISDAAESLGFRTYGVRINLQQLQKQSPVPCIAHWKQKHFIVIHRITKKFVYVNDPAFGPYKYTHKEFMEGWCQEGSGQEAKGLCLLLEPTPDFFSHADEKIDKARFSYLFTYLKPYKKYILQLVLGLVLGSLLQLIFPFLTQAIVDIGINNQNIAFITLVLLAQLVLFISRTLVDFIRGWILLHISTRVNISLISDFLIKLMKLPIRFFDVKMIGDIMQRIQDHKRIENFLTTNTISILFTLINLLIFGVVLLIYSVKIFAIFAVGTTIYILWIILFLRKRRVLDNKRFIEQSKNQSTLYQLITGMQEIKLNNFEKQKRWEWEDIQARMFRLNVRSLSLNQYQQAGAIAIGESKNLLITFVAALAVTSGDMTLGMMLAVQFIIGQLSSPLDQALVFFNQMQDARISLERLAEIHEMEDEDAGLETRINELPADRNIHIKNMSFRYDDPYSGFVLENINLDIPENKVTAIVGRSGSGKTTLIKLLLGFYKPEKGEITIGDIQRNNINEVVYRDACGAVMQDGFIFSDTILHNIVIDPEKLDTNRFYNAIKMANLNDLINELPLNYNTKIGANGHGLSQGQKQRILIARAVYKQPKFLFFDEATNALDAENERLIMENLRRVFEGKTVIVVAHRLSTVKNADHIVVLEKGKMVESGTHDTLTKAKGIYYKLVKDQLELGG